MKRRLFLKGVAGATLAAPFLSSLHRPVKAQTAGGPQRLVIFYTNNGCMTDRWGPETMDGAVTAESLMGKTLEPVASKASKLLFPRGLAMFPRGTINGYFDPHDQGMGSKLTGAPIDATEGGSHWALGRSLDHVAAELVNPGTKTPLVLSVGRAFSNVKGIVSYRAAQEPFPPETNPRNVYTGLTGLFSAGSGAPTEADYRVLQGKSVLDLVKDDLSTFKRLKMSGGDMKKVTDWEALLFETEKQVVSAACNPESAAALGITDAAITAAAGSGRGGVDTGTAFVQGGDMMIKLIGLTMMCDANRTIILQWPGFVTFNFDGINHQYDHHGLSHRSGTNGVGETPLPGVEEMIWEIDLWYGKRYGQLVDLVDSIAEGDGTTMLDNSAVMWLPELGDGNRHNNDNLPIVIAGSAGGYLKQGVSVSLAPASTGGSTRPSGGGGGFGSGGVPLNKLHATLLNALGRNLPNWTHVDSFGTWDSNTEGITNPGELDAIKA